MICSLSKGFEFMEHKLNFLISNFRHVLSFVCFLPGRQSSMINRGLINLTPRTVM